LVKRVTGRLQVMAEGDLSERARRRAEQLARNADLRLTLPRPANATRTGFERTSAAANLPRSVFLKRLGRCDNSLRGT
jgi:hypothetical protein